MTPALASAAPPIFLSPLRHKSKSAAHRIALAIVWLTVASSAIVFSEPAPVDALTFGLFILLPVIGLVETKPMLWAGAAILLVMAAASSISAFVARDVADAATHLTVTLYLYGGCFLFAAFVAKKPEQHTKLILNAYLFAGIVAAVLGIVGYLDVVPGAFELFTKFDRATGPFKDPNVFGPFLVAPLLTALHLWLNRPLIRGLLPLAAAGIIAVAILFSYSRGAWAAAAIGVAVYAYLYMLTAPRNWDRIKLAGLALSGIALLGVVLAIALQSDSISRLMDERMAVTQPYDEGPDGRFGGQEKAFGLLLENPAGLGPQTFTRFYHHEEVHNVYLTMFLNAGWIGGLLFLLICAATLVFGFRHALKETKTAPLFLIVFAAISGIILEGGLIDSDHWRHFYLLLAIVWGLMASDRRIVRAPRIIRDSRPILMQSVLIVPPSRRSGRILGLVPRLPLIEAAANDVAEDMGQGRTAASSRHAARPTRKPRGSAYQYGINVSVARRRRDVRAERVRTSGQRINDKGSTSPGLARRQCIMIEELVQVHAVEVARVILKMISHVCPRCSKREGTCIFPARHRRWRNS